MKLRLLLLLLLLASTSAGHGQTITSIDEFLAAERASLAGSCKSIEFAEGFITHVNIDGDGLDDLLVDYDALMCDGSSMQFCGSAGCDMVLYLQQEDGRYAQLTAFFGYGIDFDLPNANPPSFVVALHGNECGVSGMAPCSIRYKIEGSEVVEVGEVKQDEDD